jgi:hypothetical protein
LVVKKDIEAHGFGKIEKIIKEDSFAWTYMIKYADGTEGSIDLALIKPHPQTYSSERRAGAVKLILGAYYRLLATVSNCI